MAKNTLIIHGCGGCGISLTVEAEKLLGSLGDGFAKVVTNYIDTTTKNIDHYPDEIGDNYHLVTDSSYSGGLIDGSGGLIH